MARGTLLLMSFWLFCLWFAGVSATPNLGAAVWATLAVSGAMLFAALSLNSRLYGHGSALASLLFGVALIGIWGVGIGSSVTPAWLNWCNLANGAVLLFASAAAWSGHDMAVWTPDRSDDAPGGADWGPQRLSA